MPTLHFITHPEVVVDPSVPVPDWPLSPEGIRRMGLALNKPWMSRLGTVFSSAERKARDAARIVADRFGFQPAIVAELGENDRSATGYLPRRRSRRRPTSSSLIRKRACADGSAQSMLSAESWRRWSASSQRPLGLGISPLFHTAVSARSC